MSGNRSNPSPKKKVGQPAQQGPRSTGARIRNVLKWLLIVGLVSVLVISAIGYLAYRKTTIPDVVDAYRLGMSAVKVRASVCPGAEAHVVGSSGFPRLDALAVQVLEPFEPFSASPCAEATVVIDRWESCVL